jgi:zinc-RING finger domain
MTVFDDLHTIDHFVRAMSSPSFQAHQLVYCAKCYLPYDVQVNITQQTLPPDVDTRKWYLTSCGHSLCSTCLYQGDPPGESLPDVPCPSCGVQAVVVELSDELPSEILPYFRSLAENSEEMVAAIKFQHQNLLRLVDYLRSRVDQLSTLVRSAREQLERQKDDQMYVHLRLLIL